MLVNREDGKAVKRQAQGKSKRRGGRKEGERTPPCGMTHMAVRRIEGDGGRYYVLPVAEVLYAFLRNAAHRNRVRIRQYDVSVLTKNRVYVRTAKGVFLTPYRTLQDLQTALGHTLWMQDAAQGIAVNVRKLSGIEVRGLQRLACLVQPEQEPDQLVPSRYCAREILRQLGVRRRRMGKS